MSPGQQIVILVQNFEKFMTLAMWWMKKASKSSYIASRVISYNPPGIYFFKVNNAGWEV